MIGYTEGRRIAGFTIAATYIGTIAAANWAITTFGIVPVGFGLMAPAGVYFAGLAFTLRDFTQELLGRRTIIATILAGTAVSWLIADPRIAIASAIAFLVSELADFAVYTPLCKRSMWQAIAASNTIGLVVDSVLFLSLAFGSLAFLPGQIVGKTWITAASVGLVVIARAVLRQPIHTKGA